MVGTAAAKGGIAKYAARKGAEETMKFTTARRPFFKSFAKLLLAAVMVFAVSGIPARAQTVASVSAKKSAPNLEQRVADIEAALNNGSRGSDVAGAKITSDIPGAEPGQNAWMMVCTALVLFMTLPGLALFYGGLVRRKNVLSVLAQCMGITGLVTILWWICGYSLVFGTSFGSGLLGGTEFLFLHGVDSMPNGNYSHWVSQNVFSMFELMFAIITPALIIGAIAERMKFAAVLTFVGFWMFLVYFPLAHMVWGADGLMNGVWNSGAKITAIDFAGGSVVEMASGFSALVLCLILGPRLGFGKEKMAPHSMVLCMVGTGMLWVGWYGFNAGSAVAANGISANAFMVTTLTGAVASTVWAFSEYLHSGKASVLGFCSGAVSGLVVITPACGFVDANGAIILGILAGVIPFLAVLKLKAFFGYDDALDTFGLHGVGGVIGMLCTGFLATSKVNPNLAVTNPPNVATVDGVAHLVATHMLWIEQIKVIGITMALAVGGSAIIGFTIKATMGLRPNSDIETQGLDINEHREEGYIL